MHWTYERSYNSLDGQDGLIELLHQTSYAFYQNIYQAEGLFVRPSLTKAIVIIKLQNLYINIQDFKFWKKKKKKENSWLLKLKISSQKKKKKLSYSPFLQSMAPPKNKTKTFA